MDKHLTMTNPGFLTITVTSKRSITRQPPTAFAPTPDLPPLLQKPPVLPADAETTTDDDTFKE